jgi:hypothetical protein
MVAHIALADRKGFFQQDGAPAHRAKSTTKLLGDRIPLIPDWPPNSPDLSPIENVWGILKIRLAAREPKNVAGLRATLLEEWDNLEQDIIDRLIGTMPERFQMCITAEGKFIGHLVRRMGHRQEREPSEIPVKPSQDSEMEIRKLEAPHVGTIVTLTARPGVPHPDRQNPAIQWVEMKDLPGDDPAAPCRRRPGRIGMMFLEEERSMIPTTPFTFRAEVCAASGRFLEGATAKARQTRKMHLCLRLIAVEAEGQGPVEAEDREDGAELRQASLEAL